MSRDVSIVKREYIQFIIGSAKYTYIHRKREKEREIYVCHWFNYDWTNRVAFMYKCFYLC